ncbi:NnrS family protein [Aquipseudomonas campi]
MHLLDRDKALAIAPIWRLGFRPFFLAGAAFAVIAIVLWGAWLQGLLPTWQPAGGMLAWHRHEMPFGFAAAIIAGFLLSAVQTWTGTPGLSGRPLLLLAGLWLVARLAWAGSLPPLAVAALQLPFLPVLAIVLGRQIWRARQKNNYPIVGVLLLLSLCQGHVLAGLALGNDEWQRRGALAALWLIAALLGVIGGRVIPFFTQRGLSRPQPFAAHPKLDRLGLACALLIATSIAAGPGLTAHAWLAPLFLVFAALHALRLWRWRDRRLCNVPLLWSLHLAYAWLPVAALGMAAWHLGLPLASSLASHALAVGAMSGLILAMIARVSLGHTGRPLHPPPTIAWAFAALQLATLARVVVAAFSPWGLWLAVGLWALAFFLFLVSYAPILCRARADGQPG